MLLIDEWQLWWEDGRASNSASALFEVGQGIFCNGHEAELKNLLLRGRYVRSDIEYSTKFLLDSIQVAALLLFALST